MTNAHVRAWLAVLAAGLACGDDPTAPPMASAARSLVIVSMPSVRSGGDAVLTLQARDANGARITSGGLEVRFTVAGGTSEGVIAPDPATDRGDGTYVATFTGTIAGEPATIGALLDGRQVTSPLPQLQVLPGAASVATSVVSVSRLSVDEGGEALLGLRTKDAAGNALTEGGLQVAFAVSGGTSAGTIGPVTDHDDGSYSAVFTGTTAGTPLTVAATIDGEPVATEPPTIAVSAGAIALELSELTISADSVTVGTAVTVTLITRDADGNDLTGGGRTVVFFSSDDVIGAVDTTIDHDDGRYSTTFTAASPGDAAVGAMVDGDEVPSESLPVHVLDRAVSPQRSAVFASDDTLAAGEAINLALQVRDDDGSDLPAGGLTVLFTAADSLAGVITPDPAIDNGDGTYSGSFTGLRAPEDVILGAMILSDGPGDTVDSTLVEMLDDEGVSQLPVVTVLPAAASTDSSVVDASDAVLGAGETATLTLTARDAFGNQAITGGLAVGFTQTDGPNLAQGTIGAVTDHGDGTYTAPFTATRVGDPTTIGATIDGAMVTSTPLPTIAVLCGEGAPAADSSLVTVSDATAPSGVPLTVTLRARDALGNCLTTTGLDVTFATSGGPGESTGSFGATVDNGDGTYAAVFTGVLAGGPTQILGAIDGETTATAPPTVTVTPGDVSAMTSSVSVSDSLIDVGTAATVTLQARDAAGNAIVAGGRSVVFTQGGGSSTGMIGTTTDHGDGTYTAPFTGTGVGTPTSLSATIDGTPLMTAPAAIEVSTVSVDQSIVTVDGQAAVTVTAGDVVTLLLRARDPAGRDVNGSGHAVAFALSGGSGDGTIGAVTDHGDGTYSAALTAETAGTAASVSATIDGTPVTTPPPTVTVEPGPASPATSVVSASDSVVAVGGMVTLTLEARDAFGNALDSGGLEVAFTASSGAGVSEGTIAPVPATDNGDGSYTAAFTGTASGTPATIGATIDGVAVATELPVVRVE